MATAQGTYGPFRPQMPTRVPLWLALFLKRRRRCTIITPEWLQKGALRLAARLAEFPGRRGRFSPTELAQRCGWQTTWTPS
jgi:hypothetical protein